MYCRKCGSQIQDNQEFCPYCGVQLKAPAAPEQAEEQPVQQAAPAVSYNNQGSAPYNNAPYANVPYNAAPYNNAEGMAPQPKPEKGKAPGLVKAMFTIAILVQTAFTVLLCVSSVMRRKVAEWYMGISNTYPGANRTMNVEIAVPYYYIIFSVVLTVLLFVLAFVVIGQFRKKKYNTLPEAIAIIYSTVFNYALSTFFNSLFNSSVVHFATSNAPNNGVYLTLQAYNYSFLNVVNYLIIIQFAAIAIMLVGCGASVLEKKRIKKELKENKS